MSMDPPKILLEQSFLRSVADPAQPRHAECVAAYTHLVARYEREEILLVAVGDHLRAIDVGDSPGTAARVQWFLHRRRVGIFAPVDPLYVGFQHRRAARAATVDDPDVALTLVMCERHRVRQVATTLDELNDYDLDLLPLSPTPSDATSDEVPSAG
jgi:hypothetical protein